MVVIKFVLLILTKTYLLPMTCAEDDTRHQNCTTIITNSFNGGTLDESRTDEIYNCLSELGQSRLTDSQATAIWNSLKTIFNGTENIPKGCIKRMGWALIGIPADDYQLIDIDDIEMVEIFGVYHGLNREKMYAIVERIRSGWANKEPEDYSQFDLMALNQLLCHFNRSDIERIHPDAYKEAATVIGKVENCSLETLQAFAELAVQSNAFGYLEKWTKFDIIAIGNVIAGLSSQQFSMIPSNLHEYINLKHNYNIHTNNNNNNNNNNSNKFNNKNHN